MDLMGALRYVSEHDETVFGALVVVTLVTSVVLIIRQIGQKNVASEGGGGGGGSSVDLEQIEDAMKRALATQPAPVVVAGPAGDVDTEALNAAVREREAKIAALNADLEKVRAELAAGSGAGTVQTGEPDTAKVTALETRIGELMARLQEYEIIEDDIADLSMFKDENQRLKHEIERLRQAAPEAAAAVPSAEDLSGLDALAAAPEPAPAPVAEPAPAPAVAETAPLGAPVVEDDVERVSLEELSAEDDVMKQFTSAVEVQRAPKPDVALKVEPEVVPEAVATEPAATASADDDPFGGALDPEKIMSEVEALPESDVVGDALEESLDTDKLLAEMGSMDDGVSSAAADLAAVAVAETAAETSTETPTEAPAPVAPEPVAAAAPVAAAPAPAPAPAAAAAPATPVFNMAASEAAPEEDLLAEFKDFKDTKS